MYDAIVVGGGPAGLSAALILGRSRRKVLVCDAGRPRNASAQSLHGFLSRDGIAPAELLEIARSQLQSYPNVHFLKAEVVDVRLVDDGGFEVSLASGSHFACRKLLLANGVVDVLPKIEGIEAFYGRGVHHCPYCDGWEYSGSPLAVYGSGAHGFLLAKKLLGWSPNIVLCTNGPNEFSGEDERFLARHGIIVRRERLLRLEGKERLERLIFEDGSSLEREALFFGTAQFQRSPLAAKLHCEYDKRESIKTNGMEMTSIDGVYVAGDASRDVQLAIVAAAEGAKAAFAINSALLAEDFGE